MQYTLNTCTSHASSSSPQTIQVFKLLPTSATAREINEVPLSSKPRAHAACKQRELCKAPFPSSSPWMASAPRERQGAPPVSSHSSNLRQGTWAAAPHRTTISYTPSHLADPPDDGVVWDQKKRRGMDASVLTMTSANGWGCTTEVQVHFAFEPFIGDINLLISYAKSANKLRSDTSPS